MLARLLLEAQIVILRQESHWRGNVFGGKRLAGLALFVNAPSMSVAVESLHRFLPMETVGLQPTEEIGIARRLCERNPLLQYRVK